MLFDAYDISTGYAHYIEWISKNMSELLVTMKDKFEKNRKSFLKEYSHGRMCEAISWLLLSYDLYLKYGVSIDKIDNKKRKKELESAKKIFMEIMKNQDTNMFVDKPLYMYLTALDQLISSKQIVLETIGSKSNNSFKRCGWHDQDYYYLLPEVTYNEVALFWKKQNKEFPLSQSKLNELLHKSNLIKVEKLNGNEIRRTIKKKVHKNLRPRVIYLKRDELKKYLEDNAI